MVLSDAHRTTLFTALAPVVGDDDAVHGMLSHFPVAEGDEHATKQFVRAEVAVLRSEMHAEFADVRTELANVRTEMRTGFAEVRTEMQRLAVVQLRWMLAAQTTTLAIVVALVAPLR